MMQDVGLALDTHPNTHRQRHPPTRAKEEHDRSSLRIWRCGKTRSRSFGCKKTEERKRGHFSFKSQKKSS